jgi:hypothetical protein
MDQDPIGDTPEDSSCANYQQCGDSWGVHGLLPEWYSEGRAFSTDEMEIAR